jgi:hypothetical protein
MRGTLKKDIQFKYFTTLVIRLSSGLYRRVVWYTSTEGSEVPAASIIRTMETNRDPDDENSRYVWNVD